MNPIKSSRIGRAIQVVIIALVALSAPASHSQTPNVFEPAMRFALGPVRSTAQYNYVMTGKVRLLLLWFSADDVGGGYVRRGVSLADPSVRFIQVLFGSDPAKAPRRINHWGAATETMGPYSTLFGFMKSAKTASADAAEAEITRQSEKGEHAFEGIVSIVERGRAVSRVVPLMSTTDFNIHQLPQAQKLVVERLSRDGPIREFNPATRKCGAARGFLQAVDELAQQALGVPEGGQSLCYVHNSRDYTLTLRKRSVVKKEEVEFKLKSGRKVKKVYQNLVSAEFTTFNHQSGEETDFELLLGTKAEFAGVPVRIVHQPNFWFKVVLNLDTVQ